MYLLLLIVPHIKLYILREKYNKTMNNQDRAKRAEAETVRGTLFIHKPYFPSRQEIGS